MVFSAKVTFFHSRMTALLFLSPDPFLASPERDFFTIIRTLTGKQGICSTVQTVVSSLQRLLEQAQKTLALKLIDPSDLRNVF